jgi:hypothetical protein
MDAKTNIVVVEPLVVVQFTVAVAEGAVTVLMVEMV